MVNFHEFWLIIEATSTYAVSPEESMRMLGLAQGYSAQQLEDAYRKAAAKTHPDRGGDPIAFKKIQAAYETLKGRPQNASPNQSGPRQTKPETGGPSYSVRPIPTKGGARSLAGWEMEVLRAAKAAEQRGADASPIYEQMLRNMEAELERILNTPNPDQESTERKNRLMQRGPGGIEGWRNFVSMNHFRGSRQRQTA
jgi:curved DNA-binding protein CbpA